MAADATVETLQIQIETSSSDAAKKVNELSQALRDLKKASKGGAGLSNVTTELDKIKNASIGASKFFRGLKAIIGAIGMRRIVSFLGDAVSSINEYVETLNLFKVSMGSFYDEAYEYAELVNEKLGVDPAQWMKAQGVFMSMGKGFGMSEKQAYGLSKSLTELSYDIASLYNEDIQQATNRLQSALAGEIEPIRRLGISISQATLEEYALSKGINESVASMTEQEKALLRSLKLIESSQNIGAVGDFAKTLESPANAIRVLNQQFTQFKRAIGSVFLPAIVQSLPYIQAFTSLLTDLISKLAVFVGFTMPEWDANDWADGMSDFESNLSGAAGAAKEVKKQLIGIDELNVLSNNKSNGAGAAGGVSDWAKDLEIPSLWNEKQIKAIEKQASKLKKKLEPILELALKIGAAFLAIKIADSVFSAVSKLKEKLDDLKVAADGGSKGRLLTIGITLAVTGAILEWDAIKDVILEGMDWENLAELVIAEGALISGGAMIGKAFGNAFMGGAIGGIVASVPAFIASIYDAINEGLSTENGLSIITNGAILGASIGGLIAGPIGAGVGAAIGAAVGAVTDLAIYIGQNWDQIKEEAESDWNAMVYQWNDTIETFKVAGEKIGDWVSNKWNTFWDNATLGFRTSVEQIPIEWEEFMGKIKNGWDTFENSFKNGWINFWNGAGGVVTGVVNGIISVVESGLNWVIKELNAFSVKVPDWEIFGNWAGKNFGFNLSTVKLGRVSFTEIDAFKFGGFPDHGQMFIAREAGPELVGQIGSRTAVANNDQIVAGIAQGVANANGDVVNAIYAMAQQIVRAVNEQSGDIYLDYDKVGRKMTQYASDYARARG